VCMRFHVQAGICNTRNRTVVDRRQFR
jgi:hypothetical protein